ncbi:amino acid permease/ SLC12A domain-containing protein [Favolaschia claudopus]|uniref:Amino acid permease/ SLC12A domain-containing protein n=1 Tax=Favolaschia claudopus TaxID=2862362 RepID=A0AAV9ZLY5_9AGAR
MKSLAMTTAEVQNPTHSLAKAVHRVSYRILMFYVRGILIVGMLVPSNDHRFLQETGTAASSPFVLAMTRAGLRGRSLTVLSDIAVINAGVLSPAFSAGNSGLHSAFRQIYGLALRGQAPRISAKTMKVNTALAFSSVWILLSYMALSSGASAVLNWLSNFTSILGFCTWRVISWTYIRFYRGMKAQGIDRTKFPYPAYWALIYKLFETGDWDVSDFIIAYINLPLFAGLYFIYKPARKSKTVHCSRMDFNSNVEDQVGPAVGITINPSWECQGRRTDASRPSPCLRRIRAGSV